MKEVHSNAGLINSLLIELFLKDWVNVLSVIMSSLGIYKKSLKEMEVIKRELPIPVVLDKSKIT